MGTSGGQHSHGRHRANDGAVAWVPHVREDAPTGSEEPPRHARPESPLSGQAPLEPSEEPTEPHVFGPLPTDPPEAPSTTGLGTFNLGTVPASVTPPGTWRRAAWFSVLASAGVLVAMVFLTTSLVGPPSPAGSINSLPGVPSGLPHYALSQSSESTSADQAALVSSDPTSATRRGTVTSTRSSAARTIDTTSAKTATFVAMTSAPPGTGTDEPSPTSRTSVTSVRSVTSVTSSSYPPPEVTTERPEYRIAPPRTDPDAMTARSRHYFALVASDPAKAGEMTTDEDAEDIRSRYPDADSVQVNRIVVDPQDGSTTDSVTIHKDDGSTVTKTRTLTFTDGDDPQIRSDSPGNDSQ